MTNKNYSDKENNDSKKDHVNTEEISMNGNKINISVKDKKDNKDNKDNYLVDIATNELIQLLKDKPVED